MAPELKSGGRSSKVRQSREHDGNGFDMNGEVKIGNGEAKTYEAMAWRGRTSTGRAMARQCSAEL